MLSPPAAPARPVTVGLVEDDDVLRGSLGQMVSEAEGFRLCGAVGTLADGLGLLAQRPDVLLVDLALPDGSGLDLIAEARGSGSQTRLLVLTVFADVHSVVRAIEEGADGYLLKEADIAQVAGAIKTVLAGGAPISPAVAGHILAKVRGEPRRRPAAPVVLTAKETEVLEALAEGSSFKEVAAKQGISPHTVGDHVKAIYRKLSVRSRGEAVWKAAQAGLIRLGG